MPIISPDPIDTGTIAARLAELDPAYALAFLDGERRPQDFQAIATFQTTGKDHPVIVEVAKSELCDVVIYDAYYVIERPNYLADSPNEKFPADVALQLMPYVDMRLELVNCERQSTTDMMQPIQTVLRSPQQFPPACCMTYYLPQRGYIRVYLQSTRDITAEEAPLRVRCVFKGIKLPSTTLAAVRDERGETVGVRLQQRLNMLVERSGL